MNDPRNLSDEEIKEILAVTEAELKNLPPDMQEYYQQTFNEFAFAFGQTMGYLRNRLFVMLLVNQRDIDPDLIQTTVDGLNKIAAKAFYGKKGHDGTS